MKLISLQSIVLLLSASTAVARDVDSYHRQDTRQSSIIDEQHLLDDDTAIQVDKETSYGFLEAFTNHLRPWWTNHVAKLDNGNPVHLKEEHDIIELSPFTVIAGQGPGIASNIHSSSTSTSFDQASHSGYHIKERTILGDKLKQYERQTKTSKTTATKPAIVKSTTSKSSKSQPTSLTVTASKPATSKPSTTLKPTHQSQQHPSLLQHLSLRHQNLQRLVLLPNLASQTELL